MPYKNIVFIKLEKRLLNDHRWFGMSDKAQLLYIKLILGCAETYNKLPTDWLLLRRQLRCEWKLNVFQKAIDEIQDSFPKFKKNGNFYYFEEFENKTNYIRESLGSAQVLPKEGVDIDIDKEKDIDKDIDKDITETITKKETKTLENRMTELELEVMLYKGEYPKEMLQAFWDYWSEPNISKTKMRKELQKTWDTKRRLKTWAKNQNQFSNKDNKVENLRTVDDYKKTKDMLDKLNTPKEQIWKPEKTK